VLHEIASADSDTARPPRMSNYFSPQRGVFGGGRDVPVDPDDVIAALPVPVVDPSDPGAAVLATTSGTSAAKLEHALSLARSGAHVGSSSSIEIPLRLVRASLEIGAPKDARKRLADLETVIPGDWRLAWYSGQCSLLEHEFDKAAVDFDMVLATLPGELAPKLALAATAELRGNREEAARYYETIWRTDRNYVSAVFGLARQRMRAADRAGAVSALDQVPTDSAHFTAAGATAIEILLDGQTPESLDEKTLLDAGKRSAALAVESTTKRATIRLSVFGAALDWLRAGNQNSAPRLLGAAFDESDIRTGMERAYRDVRAGTFHPLTPEATLAYAGKLALGDPGVTE